MAFLEECTKHRSEALRVARPEAMGLERTKMTVDESGRTRAHGERASARSGLEFEAR
jgi:hypothetical protein